MISSVCVVLRDLFAGIGAQHAPRAVWPLGAVCLVGMSVLCGCRHKDDQIADLVVMDESAEAVDFWCTHKRLPTSD